MGHTDLAHRQSEHELLAHGLGRTLRKTDSSSANFRLHWHSTWEEPKMCGAKDRASHDSMLPDKVDLIAESGSCLLIFVEKADLDAKDMWQEPDSYNLLMETS